MTDRAAYEAIEAMQQVADIYKEMIDAPEKWFASDDGSITVRVDGATIRFTDVDTMATWLQSHMKSEEV